MAAAAPIKSSRFYSSTPRSVLPAAPLRHLRLVLEGLQRIVGDRDALSSTIRLGNCPARFHLPRLREPFIPRIVVLPQVEIPPAVSVQSLGVVQ